MYPKQVTIFAFISKNAFLGKVPTINISQNFLNNLVQVYLTMHKSPKIDHCQLLNIIRNYSTSSLRSYDDYLSLSIVANIFSKISIHIEIEINEVEGVR